MGTGDWGLGPRVSREWPRETGPGGLGRRNSHCGRRFPGRVLRSQMLRASAFPPFVIALVLGVGFLAADAPLTAQSDLDALMAKVLTRRDDNWKKLQQYVLNERETFQLLAPGSRPMFGFR